MSATFSALVTATGTVGQIDVTVGEYPVYSLANNPVLPGSGSVVVPHGTTAQRVLGLGAIRLNTTTGFFECSSDNATWANLAVGGGGIASVSGTANRITSTGGANPIIDISAAYVGQASITTLGTIGTGVWAGTAISAIHGGTSQTTYILGDTLYASAANTLSKLAGNITNAVQYLAQTGTGAVSAAPVWTTISGGDITGAALTKVDDTNVTLTLGGTPATSLLRAASITAGWAGQLSLARGGTNAALVADNGALVYSTAGALALLASTATANQIPLSGSHAAPTWSTATYPATTTINQILYSSAANTITGLATANSAALVTTSAGIPVFSATMTNGQVIIGSTGATPVAASITAGAGVTITPGAGTLTISATGSGGTVTSVSGTLNRITSTGGTTPVIDIDAAYVGQTSITTLGTIGTGVWAGTNIALNHGGTNAALTASNGGIFYSTATAGAILAGTATAQQLLMSGASTTPQWSTSTYPLTNAINTLLYASSANTMAALATANNGVLITSGTGAPSISSTLPSAVQGNITAVGALASGSLTAGFTPVAIAQGGTAGTTTTTARGNLQIPFGNMTPFTTLGASTFTTNSTTTVVYVRCWGAGGGGGGSSAAASGAGGGGSGYTEGFVSVAASTGYTVTVGTGGSGGAASLNGTAGGLSSFAGISTITGNGGGGGTFNGAGGAGGTATSGILNITGQAGDTVSAANINIAGGNSAFFAGAGRTTFVAANSENAFLFGSGGSGSYVGGNGTGGNGSNGLVLVYF